MARFVVLNSKLTNKNVSYVKDGGELHQFLQTSGEDVGSPYSKFELEAAKSGGNEGLVNIRCCYNNTYWVITTTDSSWIVATADKPDEDVTKSSCTLFEPVYVDDDAKTTTVRFLHAQNKKCASYRETTDNAYNGCLYAGSADSLTTASIQSEFEVIDWETLVIFPKRVAFKGGVIDNDDDIGNEKAGYEIFPTPNRSVCIKSNLNGKFWRRSPNSITADSTETSTNDPDTLFLPIKVKNNVVALRNMGNNQFCSRRLTTAEIEEGKTNCNFFNASSPTISQLERMEVEELVSSRTIDNVVYRLTDSRIYDEHTLTVASGVVANNTQQPTTTTIKLRYSESWTRIWNTSVSLSLGIKANVQMGIPKITSVGVEIVGEFKGEYAWGESQVTPQELAMEYTVTTVPPRTRVKVSLVATKGKCDVPFSFSQHDTLTTSTGQQITFNKDDGVFTGINCFNFRFETTEEKL